MEILCLVRNDTLFLPYWMPKLEVLKLDDLSIAEELSKSEPGSCNPTSTWRFKSGPVTPGTYIRSQMLDALMETIERAAPECCTVEELHGKPAILPYRSFQSQVSR
jgi:hypothetical protein